jgi:glycosyl transferase family 1
MKASSPVVDISAGSRFWAFDLARELSHAGMLGRLYTGYPSFLGPRFGVPRESIRSVWTTEPLNRTLAALRRRNWMTHAKDSYVSQRHDRIVSSRLRPGANVFVGWSGQCRRSLAVARRLGMTTVVERGSSHINWQWNELTNEAQATGLPVDVPDARTIEQELAEYEMADYIVVPSTFAANTFVAKGVPRAKMFINQFGVDLTLFSNESHRSPTGTGLQVLHVGRVGPRKGVHYLMDAVRGVADAHLTLVGAVEPEMDVHVRGRDHVTVAGAVAAADLPSWYRKADVFCLLSVEEGLALVMAQAMAMGLPVIATPNTGAEDLIEDGVQGFIVPARDPSAAVRRLQLLADSPELRKEMGRRGRERVLDGFAWADYGRRAASFYQRVLKTKAAGDTAKRACAL